MNVIALAVVAVALVVASNLLSAPAEVFIGNCPYKYDFPIQSPPEGYVKLTERILITGASTISNNCYGGTTIQGNTGFTCDYPVCGVVQPSGTIVGYVMKGTPVALDGSGWSYYGYGIMPAQAPGPEEPAFVQQIPVQQIPVQRERSVLEKLWRIIVEWIGW